MRVNPHTEAEKPRPFTLKKRNVSSAGYAVLQHTTPVYCNVCTLRNSGGVDRKRDWGASIEQPAPLLHTMCNKNNLFPATEHKAHTGCTSAGAASAQNEGTAVQTCAICFIFMLHCCCCRNGDHSLRFSRSPVQVLDRPWGYDAATPELGHPSTTRPAWQPAVGRTRSVGL